ncbi:MAG: triose-phosphate isomerase [Patescibacteria group bacterium]|nr:triose-phosphate isomerase [Patescibacteria group bacterium]
MSKKTIIANWKMNPDNREEAEKLASLSDREGVVICPPFIFMETVLGTVKKGKVGAQNCFCEEKGAFTGEVSPLALKNMGCEYVIAGHSERRNIFQETSENVNKKTKKAMELGLKTVVCVGEKKECKCDESDYENAEYIKKQLQESLLDTSLENLIIAYEPVSAIGSGCPIPVYIAKDKMNFIKKVLIDIYQIDINIPILYGGSVNEENASSYLYDAGFDGLLVGGASLDGEHFQRICRGVEHEPNNL